MTLRASKPAFNVREKLTELGRRFGLKGSELAAAETVQEARDLVSAGRRNIIINGNFDIWQRGTSTTGALSNAYGSADRWMFHTRSLTTRNISRQAFTDGQTDVPGNPLYYLRFETSNNSGSFGAYMMQRIEDVRVGAGEDVTVSFYAKTNSGGGTFQAAFSQQFGSGGSAATDNVAGSFTPTSSWKKYYFTINLPSISGKTIGTNNYLRFDIRFPANTAVTLDISKIQLERGINSTDFEHRSYGEELALCKRYYQVWKTSDSDFNGYEAATNDHSLDGIAYSTYLATGSVNDGDDAQVVMRLSVEMRDKPSATLTDARLVVGPTLYNNTTTIQLNNSSRDTFSAFVDNGGTMTSGQSAQLLLKGTGALLALDAEL